MTGPEDIEDARFAASLGINLAAMTRTSSGLYYEDIEAGTGEPTAAGQDVQVAYAGWLKDGTEFDRRSVRIPPGSRSGSTRLR